VWYADAKLCDGSQPEFFHGHRNKTQLHLALTRQMQYGSGLMTALQEQQQTGRILLDPKVDAQVAIKLGRILRQCLLIVDVGLLTSVKRGSGQTRMGLTCVT
jgi:hypothetical protein